MPSQPRQRVNILLVDDQPAKLLSYELILKETGEHLLKAGSAREALELLLRTEIAVVLIDVCMPELDGFELATMIREHPRFQKTAIIFVSAIQITEFDSLRGYEAGAVDYVSVPVVPEVLRAKVRVFADLYRKTRELERLNADLERRVGERTAELERTAESLRSLNEELEHRIEQRTQERELALAQLFEARKMETIGQLTGGVAHDFNNLLMAVLGSLELLKKRLPAEDARAARLLGNAIQGAERGAALTQRLLAFARRQELRPEAVDVAQLVGGMADLLERALGPTVKIECSIPAELPPVRVDANQLELAVLNLAVNARDAMPHGGSLFIRAAVAPALPSEAGPQRPGAEGYIRLDVVDTGVGMDEATRARAVEPFFTTKGPGKGTGLGLSMVQGLAAQSGGAMTLASAPGDGTTVALWLPRAEPRPLPAIEVGRRATAGVPVADGPHRAYAVLVVDDDGLVGAGTAAMLEDLGHAVVVANSAGQALDLLRANPGATDIVVTDHAMPGMTGMELVRELRRFDPRLPVILTTGYAELPESAQDFPEVPRLAKPFRQSELSSALATAMAALTVVAEELADGAQPASR